MRRSTCCQQPLKAEFGMPWLFMRRHGLKLRHLWVYLNGERSWFPFVRLTHAEFTSFGELEPNIKGRPKLGANVGRLARISLARVKPVTMVVPRYSVED